MAAKDVTPGHQPNTIAKEKFVIYNYLIILAVSSGALAVGMVNGMINTTLGQPSFLTYFGFLNFTKANTPLIGAVTGVFFAAALFGCATASYIADRLGRKWALAIAACISITSCGLVAGSVKISMLLVFRFTSGFSSGMLMSTTTLLQSELSPPHHRGLMVGLVGVGISYGYVLSNWIGVGFYFVQAGGAQWRIPFALCTVPSFMLLGFLFFIPESPRWLILHGHIDQAAVIIARLHSTNDDASKEFAMLEVVQMKAQIQSESSVTWWEFWTSPIYRRRLMLTAITMIMSQSAGIVVIVTYGPTIYASLGFSTVAQLCITAGYVTSGATIAMLSTLIIDRMGRVKVLIIGTVIQIVFLIIATPIIKTYAGSTNLSAQRAVVAIFYIFEGGYCFLEGASYTYVGELWPVHLRAKGSALGVASIYFIDIIYVEASLYAFATIGWKFYLVFIILGTFFLGWFILIAKETKGRSLEEIGAIFGDNLASDTLDEMIEKEKLELGVSTVAVDGEGKVATPTHTEKV